MAGGGQGWILVVEDEPGQLTLCLDRLGALGYCAYGAANAEEATEELAAPLRAPTRCDAE